jgi:hypothetical protein
MTSPNESPKPAPPKKSLLSQVKGIFVEEEQDPKPATTAAQPAQTAQLATRFEMPRDAAGSIAVPPIFTPAQPPLNPEMLERLRAKAYERASPFKTLLSTAEKMKGVVPDDRARLQAAFAVVASDGQRSAQSIFDSIKAHISDVEGERARFRAAAEGQKAAKVDAPLREAENLTKTIDANAASIAKLQAENQAAQARVAELNELAHNGDNEILTVTTQFDAAADFVVGELNQQQAALATVLK